MYHFFGTQFNVCLYITGVSVLLYCLIILRVYFLDDSTLAPLISTGYKSTMLS